MSTAPAFAPACSNHPDVSSGIRFCSLCGHPFCGSCLIELNDRVTCAQCKDDVLRDLRSGTAELELSTPTKRLFAVIIDTLLVRFPLMGLSWVLFVRGPLKEEGGMFSSMFTLFNLFPVFAYVIYDALMLANGGQTLGKKFAGVKVVTAEGKDITPAAAWLRSGSTVVMGFTYILGIIDTLSIFSERRRTLHDRIARTVVIDCRR